MAKNTHLLSHQVAMSFLLIGVPFIVSGQELPEQQLNPIKQEAPGNPKPTNPKPTKPGASGNQSEEGPLVQIPKKEWPPNYIRLHLQDGDIVSGILETDSISITTDFGTLSVPVEKILRFEPGLISKPQLLVSLDELVQQLGSDKYQEREIAHKKLLALGIKIRNELENYKEEKNAERKRHLGEIKKEIEKLISEIPEDEADEPENQPWEKNDKLVMAHFTAVGKIQQETYRLSGKYGQLTVKLADINKGSRPTAGREAIDKSLTLDQSNFVQLKYKPIGIKLEKGDTVSVTATGSLVLTPWGGNVSCSPNGTPQYGVMPNTPGIPFGCLVAKIGNNGKYFKVGEKNKFVATAAGSLQFAITMRSSYVGKNYQFPGEYKLRVKVQPTEE
jgi:hypothetical protein